MVADQFANPKRPNPQQNQSAMFLTIKTIQNAPAQADRDNGVRLLTQAHPSLASSRMVSFWFY